MRVQVDSVLGWLKVLSNVLEQVYGWPESDAVKFVLCDTPPHLPLGRWSAKWNPGSSGPQSITLEVNAGLSPRHVSALFLEARAVVCEDSRTQSTITEKHAELAVFSEQRNDGRSWEEVMCEWNQHHPDYAYCWGSPDNFSRDCRQAHERITGRQLKWKGARGRPTKGKRTVHDSRR